MKNKENRERVFFLQCKIQVQNFFECEVASSLRRLRCCYYITCQTWLMVFWPYQNKKFCVRERSDDLYFRYLSFEDLGISHQQNQHFLQFQIRSISDKFFVRVISIFILRIKFLLLCIFFKIRETRKKRETWLSSWEDKKPTLGYHNQATIAWISISVYHYWVPNPKTTTSLIND